MVYDKVSILIPAYNAAQFLAQTLESALGQDWPNLEVIVVDDGSKDNTLAVAQAYASEQVRVATQPNRGASAARNHAYALATGTYIQYLDADDLLHPQKISTQMAALRGQPARVLSSSAWGTFYDVPSDEALRPTVLWQDYPEPTEWLLAAWAHSVWMQPSAWLAHRELIAAAGPWNEQLSLHDDGEFFCRVVLASSQVVFCREARSYYRKGLAESLSSVHSPRAVRSHLEVARLYEQHLLARRSDAAARQVCATVYQRFIYEYYPAYPELRAVAASRVKGLGGSPAVPMSTPLFQKLDALVGWRLSKRIQNVVYRLGLNPAAWKAKLSR